MYNQIIEIVSILVFSISKDKNVSNYPMLSGREHATYSTFYLKDTIINIQF